jgi:purine nucleosidase
MTTRLVIDTDPGVDDAHAILLAFAHPLAKVEALTIVGGNVALPRTVANACTILDVLDQEDVPIYAGCAGPILPNEHNAAYVHGDDGLGGSAYAPSRRQAAPEHAVNALIRMANENPRELTLVAIGPLTNIALATRLDPMLPAKFKRLVVMGGAIRSMGNMDQAPSAEFNMYVDPEAAAIVFQAWPNFDLVSWETTMEHSFDAGQLEVLMNAPTPRGEFFRRITPQTLDFVFQKYHRQELYAPDPLAVAIAIEPDIVSRSERRHVTVELTGTHTRGQITVDWFNLGDREPNATIILDVDQDRFWDMMRASVE